MLLLDFSLLPLSWSEGCREAGISPWLLRFLTATAGGRRKSALQCFWPLVSQIFNHETFLWEWEFPVNSIPAETGPINTLALCYRVYLAGQWVSPCKQEAPEVIIYRCGWRATCLYLWDLKTVWKAEENVGGALGHSEHRSYSNADSLPLPPFLLRMDETQYRYNQESLWKWGLIPVS